MEEERRRRREDAQRRPAIIDPSFELFGRQSPSSQRSYDDQFIHRGSTISPASTSDDWLFQTRRASTLPRNYQFEPHCEVTPKSSVSSQNSAASSAPSQIDYDMGWETSRTARPRPQSYLPPLASASYSHSMTDLHRGSEYKSRRYSAQPSIRAPQEPLPSYDRPEEPRSAYRLQASLNRPFSIDDPLDALSEPVQDSHLYRRSSRATTPEDDDRLASIAEDDSSDALRYRDDLVKRGYRT